MAAKKKKAAITEGRTRGVLKSSGGKSPKVPPPAPKARKPRQPKADPIPHEVMAVAAGLGVPAAKVADDLAAYKPRADKADTMQYVDPIPFPAPARTEVDPAPVPSAIERRAALLEKYGKGWYDRVWIVGRYYADTWDFQGVFWQEAEAVAECIDDTWFVAPAQIGVALPVEPQPWPGLYYPVPTAEEQPAAKAPDHRAYRWGLVAVCVVVLVAIGLGLAGCAP